MRLPGFDEGDSMNEKNILYTPGARWGIDIIENGFGRYSGKPIAALMAENPGAILVDRETQEESIRSAARTDPKRITRDRFDDMLEIMPPDHWNRRGGSESFNLIEHTVLDVAATFVRIGDEYWEFEDRADLPHSERVARITEHKKQEAHTRNATAPTEA